MREGFNLFWQPAVQKSFDAIALKKKNVKKVTYTKKVWLAWTAQRRNGKIRNYIIDFASGARKFYMYVVSVLNTNK